MTVTVAITPERVRECLRTVPEPCSLLMREPTNITDMGLVERVDVAGARVEVELVLTDPSCLHYGAMRRFITDALLELEGVDEVEVRASTTVLWSPDRLLGGTA
ncbi:iron-sulfur cluster assembly protein [Sporichthya sp.]|uniref:metal-sulfur cluster assembly factor n=1 Tax=Sporichthya sp. TaxID=65475 RepID=UPI0017E037A9|nr:iron-sulfur cluster assembly protein [Sporichthya sp.]MBA3744349.1 DUF59 domain-containing protein [Sporichthya sp.]